MTIAVTNLGASSGTSPTAPDINSGTDATSYAGSSYAPPTTGIALAYFHNRRAGVAPDTPTITGWGITWTQIGSTLAFDTDYGLGLFGAVLVGATTGALTAGYGANTEQGCILSVFQVTGVPANNGLSACYVSANVKTTTGTATSGTLTMDAVASANNLYIAAFCHKISEANTQGSNFTLLDTCHGAGHARSVGTEYGIAGGATSPAMSWTTSSLYGGLGIEVVADNIIPAIYTKQQAIARASTW